MLHLLDCPSILEPADPRFYIQRTYDLSKPWEASNIARLIRRHVCTAFNMNSNHRQVIDFVFDRTIGFDKIFERITYEHFRDGVFDSNGNMVSGKLGISNPTISKCLKDLVDKWGVLIRMKKVVGKSEEISYAINLGRGVTLKTKSNGSITFNGTDYKIPAYIHKKTAVAFATVESCGESMKIEINKHMMPVSKKKKAVVQERVLTDEEKFYAADSSKNSLHPHEEILTGNSECQLKKLTQTCSEIDMGEVNNGAASPLQALQGIVSRNRDKKKEQNAKQLASIQTPKVSDIESVWKAAYNEVHKHAIPWGAKERGQTKVMMSKYNGAGLNDFAKFIDWTIRRWESIGTIWFNFKDMGALSASKRYPETPAVGFLVVCFDTYIRAYRKAELIENEPAMTPKERMVARLTVRGYDENKIQIMVDKVFKPKPEKKPVINHEETNRRLGELKKKAVESRVPVVASGRLQLVANDGFAKLADIPTTFGEY